MQIFENLTHSENQKSGVSEYLLFAPLNWFKTIAKPVYGPAILEDHILLDGYSFIQFWLAPQKNKVDLKTIGDLGGNAFTQAFEGFIAGSYAKLHEIILNTLNVPVLVFAPDPDGFFYQLGNEDVYAYLTADFTTSTTKDGAKGYTIKFVSDSEPAFYYPTSNILGVNQSGLYINGDFLIINSKTFFHENNC